MRVGVLHPGAMGGPVAACAAMTVMWAGAVRSAATRDRAESAELLDVGSIEELAARADVIISICPPAAAVDVARQVAATGFQGTYVDANAVAPSTMSDIEELVPDVVDGGIIGPPPTRPGTTRLYLSGRSAADVAAIWPSEPLDVRVIGATVGQASALKMAYASWTKGSAALLLSARALALAHGLEEHLMDEWDLSIAELRDRSMRAAAGVGPKAWRFGGEMREIAEAYADAGLPDGFHLAAADVFERLAEFKDRAASADGIVEAILD